jgi:subtilisin family serine protease
VRNAEKRPGLRRTISVIRLALALAGILALCVGAAAGGRAMETDDALHRVGQRPGDSAEHELLVRFKPGVAASDRAAVRRRNGARLTKRLPVPGLELVSIETGRSVKSALAGFAQAPGVLYAEPNYTYEVSRTPNDPLFGQLWGLHAGSDVDIDAPEAWDVSIGSSDIAVAIVDTGVAYDHPDLAPNIWTNGGETGNGRESNGVDDDGNGLVDDVRGWDWVDDDKSPLDFNGHGTHVAGTVGARGDDATGVAGVNWNVSLMPLRVGDGAGEMTASDIILAFGYAGDEGANVINGSFGGSGYSQGMLDVINHRPESLFVFAAGNGGADGIGDDNDDLPTYPCSYNAANVVCVAASDDDDVLADFSNFGASSVDLGAPGVGIVSAAPARGEIFVDGFESDLSGRWTTGASVGSKLWTRATEAKASGSWSVTDSAGSTYNANTDTWIRTVNPISFSGRHGCAVDYRLRLSTELSDGVLVEASTDGTSWWGVSGWTGSTNAAFVPLTDDLSSFDGGATFFLRFRLLSDSSINLDGAHIDDVSVACLSSTFGPSDYAPSDGTSMAAPHVSGAAALVWAVMPTARAVDVKQAILETVDPVAAMAGKTVTGGRLNLGAAAARALAGPPPRDTTKPSNPTLASPTHVSSVWSRDRTVGVTFTGASDAGGVDGFSYVWSTSATAVPDTIKEAEETATQSVSPGLADGASWYFRLITRDNDGNWSDPVTIGPFFIDGTAPANAKIEALNAFQLAKTFRVRWSALDETAGVAAYDVMYRHTHYAAYTGTDVEWKVGATAANALLSGSAGHTYCFKVRARDLAGNVSAWSAETCTALPLDNPAFKHAIGWTKRTDSGYYLNTYSTTTRRGATLTRAGVQAKALVLVATRCPSCGVVKVYWDTGVFKRVSLVARVTRKKELIPIAAFPYVRTTSLRIVVASSRRPVRIDGLVARRH